MTEIRTWYTFATDVLGYMNPRYKLVIGITRESTCKKLKEVPRFLICPKDTKRHKREIFKTIYHSLYDRKTEIILPKDQFLIKTCGEIVESFIIKPNDKPDIEFLKALGPFSTWTIDHIIDYTVGKGIMQDGVKVGTIAIFILRIYLLPKNILIYRPAEPSVSNQYFNVAVENDNILNEGSPVIPDEEFNEILSSIRYIHSLYLALKG